MPSSDQQKISLVKRLLDNPSIPAFTEEDAESADDGFADVYSKIVSIRETLKQFAKGDFSVDISVRGVVAGSLKTLQSHLRHLTWQVEQVANGDFTQRVDFMGDFSRAFNGMTVQMERLLRDSKERERLLLLEILDSCPVCFSILVDGEVRFATPFMKNFLGIEVGNSLSDFLVSLEFGEEETGVLFNESSLHWRSVVVRTKGGDIKEMLANVYPTKYYDEQGTMAWLIDITTIKRAEAELRKARDAAEDLARTKGEFVANMSHEIRTPMNAILGMAHLLRQTKLSEQQIVYVETAEKSAQMLLRIVDDVLDFSRMEKGRLAMDSLSFSPQMVLQEVLLVLSDPAGKKGLELVIEVARDVPEMVVGDPIRLKQVLLNLSDNAIKFTDKGRVCLRTSVDHLNDDGVTLLFSVSDTGIGMSEASQSRLFNPFTQIDNSMSRRYGGTGLGLVISKNLVEMMKGTIWCESWESAGTTFFFTAHFAHVPIIDTIAPKEAIPLPVSVVPPQEKNAVPTDDSDEERRVDIPKRLQGLPILLVEDNRINQLVAIELLKLKGFAVDVAANGRQAVDMIRQKEYGLVLMDLQMPEMDGFEATQLLRQDPRFAELPILAMTANTMATDREHCLEAGMNDHIAKPIDPTVLYQSIVKWAKPVESG